MPPRASRYLRPCSSQRYCIFPSTNIIGFLQQSKYGDETETVRVTIFAVFSIKRGHVQLFAPVNVIIRDHDSADRSEQRAVTDQPGKNVTRRIGHQFPWHHDDANDTGDESASA